MWFHLSAFAHFENKKISITFSKVCILVHKIFSVERFSKFCDETLNNFHIDHLNNSFSSYRHLNSHSSIL